MKYTYDFKLDAVHLYRQGKWIETPEWIVNVKNFHDMISRWAHLVECNGPEVLKHNKITKKWSKNEKFDLVSEVLSGSSIKSVADKAGIHHGMLSQWVNKYKKYGYNGLPETRKKAKIKEISLNRKNVNSSRNLKESELEELIRLREENRFIKTENAAIKKEIALREEKGAPHLKAKKQISSRSSEKRGTN